MLKKILLSLALFGFLLAPQMLLAQELLNEDPKNAAQELMPKIRSEDYIPFEKKALFDASESELLPENQEDVIYKWYLGDATPQQLGKEVVHTFTETGKYTVTLTIQQNQEEKSVSKEIFVYTKRALLLTDKTKEEDLKLLSEQGALYGIWLKLISANTDEAGFIAEESLVNKLGEETEFIKNAEMIIFYSKSSLDLQAFSRFWQKIEAKESFQIKNKLLIKITDDSLSTIARLTEQSFNVFKPQFILVTRSEALNPIFQSKNTSELLNNLGQRGIEYEIIDERSKKPFYFFLSKIITSFIANGLAPNTLYLILALPFITFLIGFARQVIGISTFGVYTPTMLTLAFMILGISFGLSVLLIVVFISYLLRLLFERVNLLYIPKVALLLSLISLSFLGIIWFLIFTNSNISIALAIFPMLVMSTISEKFLSTQSEEGIKSALSASGETIIVSVIAYYLVSWSSFADTLMGTPELLLLPLIGNVALGKFTGLRLTEYFRFRSLLRGDVEE